MNIPSIVEYDVSGRYGVHSEINLDTVSLFLGLSNTSLYKNMMITNNYLLGEAKNLLRLPSKIFIIITQRPEDFPDGILNGSIKCKQEDTVH